MSGPAPLNATPTMLLFVLAAIAVGSPQATAAQAIRYRIVSEDSEVRYRVRERLARMEFPNDAIGATREITGELALGDGGEVSASSRFQVDLRTLKSNRDRRDRYLRERTLETDKYPIMEFVPTALDGLAFPLPTSGTHAFKLVGRMTLHGVTKDAVWDAQLEFSPEGARGTATTNFAFGEYDLTIPRMAALLSVTDDIRLELDLVLVLVEGS